MLVDVTVIVTVPPAAGAVNVVVAPLAVCVALKDPQLPTGAHDQSTPALAESFTTLALTAAVPLGARVPGAPTIDTLSVPGLDTVTVAVATAE